MNINVTIVGGDERQILMAEQLAKKNIHVFCVGFEEIEFSTKDIIQTKDVPQSDMIILPIPVTRNGEEILAKFSHCRILPDTIDLALRHGSILCGGLIPSAWAENWQKQGAKILDYGKTEEFEQLNAIPSAEGAIQIALENTPYTLNGANVCVVGYGRIGKVLVKRLLGLGCHVTATARKAMDLIAISHTEATAVHTNSIAQQRPFDIIFNTVPAMVIDRAVLDSQTKNTLIIDLASKPGGVDFAYAHGKDIHCIHALSLPAKCAPLTAANNILTVIHQHFDFLEESL